MVQSVLAVRRRAVIGALAFLVMLLGLLTGAGQSPADAAPGDPLLPVLLKDVNPGTASSSPTTFTLAGSNLYFPATDAATGQELRKTDGTRGGTGLVKDIRPGIAASGIGAKSAALGGTVFFSATDGGTAGTELWKSDGTAGGTVMVKDINPGVNNSFPNNFTVAGGTLFFTATEGTTGTELWKTDGTAAGTVLVKDINPGTLSSSPPLLTAVGSSVFFSATEASTGAELWKSDGTSAGTVLVRDINTGNGGSTVQNLAVVGTTAYFSANNGFSAPGNGTELWKSDGTALGTVMVKDIVIGAGGSGPTNLSVLGTTVYFAATNGSTSTANGVELWKTDGTDLGTVMVKDIFPGPGASFPTELTPLNGILVFKATGPSPTGGNELWKTDGTTAGTVLVKDIFTGTGSGNPASFAVIGSTAYFSATNGTVAPANGNELWSTDGTTTGTVMVHDLNPGTASSSPALLTPAFGTLFFAATDGTSGIEPFYLRTNTAPAAGDDAFSTRINSPHTFPAPGVLANDTDADGDVLQAGSPSAPTNGTLTLDPNGSFTYTPNSGFSGTDGFTYAVTDGLGGSATGTVTMTVAGANQAPVAVADGYDTNEDTLLTAAAPGVLGNDSDGDSDTLSASVASAPSHGTLTLAPDGSFTYMPAANFNGTDTFGYVVSDGYGGTATGTATVTLPAVNDAPVGGADSYTINLGDPPLTVAAPGVLGNDSDVDGETLTAGSASPPSHGTLTLNGDGSFSYTPEAGFGGIDTFTYVVSDGVGGTASGTVTLNVFNESSVTSVRGEACSYSTNVSLFGSPPSLLGCGELQGTPATPRPPGPTPEPGSPVATDPSYSPHVALPTNGSGGSMTAADGDGAKAVYGPAVIHGGRWPCEEVDEDLDGNRNCPSAAPGSGPQAASTSGTPAGGTVTSSADISLHPERIPVTCYSTYGPVCHATGGFGPSPSEGDSMHVECSASKTAVTGSTTFSNAVLATSTDAEGSPVDQEPVPDNPPVNYTRHGVISNVGDVFTVVYNQHIVNADGSLTVNGVHMYLFGPTAVGELIRGSVTCGTNPTPLTPTDTVAPSCGTPVIKTMGPTDPTPQTPRSELVGVFDAGNGSSASGIQSVSNIQVTNGTVQVGNPSSTQQYLRFTPGQTGPLAISATRSNESLPMYWSFDVTDAAGNTSHCRGAEAPPVAVDDTYRTTENTALNVPAPGVLANDSHPAGKALSAGSASDPAHGTVSLLPDGSFTYVPDPLFTGIDTFTYVLSDGYGTDTGLVTIKVGPANGAPVAVDDSFSTDEDSPLTVAAPGVLGNDTDADGDTLSAGSASAPANGTVTLNGDGSFTYTPDAGFNGSDSFTYKANDGAVDSNVATVTITVAAVNDVPVAVDDAYSADEDTPLTVAAPGVLGNDTDADGSTLSAGSASAPANGTVTLNGDGSFTYTPNAGFNGPDTFTYTASDTGGASDTATVTIAVAAVNDAPVAVDDAGATNEDTPFTVPAPGVLGNDTDADGDALAAGSASVPANGTVTLNGDGSYTYTPNAGFSGLDSFTYKASDGTADSNVAMVAITVTTINDAPVAVDDAYSTAAGTVVSVAAPGVLGNDTDVDGDALSAGSASDPAGGSVALSGDGSFTYTPDAGFSGSDTFTYVASDGQGGSDEAVVTVTVTPPPAPAGPTTLSVSSADVFEGNAGPTAMVFTVTRSGDVSGTTTVTHKTSGGTATPGTDYTAILAGPLTFGPGETSKQVTVNVTGDTAPEKAETFSLTISGPPRGTLLGDSSGVGTILNDDDAAYLAAQNVVVTEGNSGSVAGSFTVTRSGNTSSGSTVKARVGGGTATAGVDYTAVAEQTLTFAPDETSRSVAFEVAGDTAAEPNETFNLTLSVPSVGTTVADASATVFIDDDDGTTAAPSSTFFSVSSLSLNEGNTATSPATFTVTRDGNSGAEQTVSYKTSGGTATANVDYTGVLSGQVTFGVGETTRTVTVDVAGETVPEKDETFNLVLFGQPKGTALGDASATATIVNDDGASYLAVSNAQVAEGSSGSSHVEVTVTRSGNTTSPATVKAKTGGGTATAGTDYTAITEVTVSFGAGETTKTVTVTVNGDTTAEPNETFNVTLFAPGPGATLSDAAGTITILNDD